MHCVYIQVGMLGTALRMLFIPLKREHINKNVAV